MPLPNTITTQQMVRSREIDFVRRFSGTILKKLMEALGVTRKIAVLDGTTLYYYKTTGTLQDGSVPEGEIIPLSQYRRDKYPIGEIALKKWRKATTAEAILKSGYNEAVRETDKKMLLDIQTGIRTDFFENMKNIGGTATLGANLQRVLANTWGQLQVLFENDSIEAVHFIHPLTISEYLGGAAITVQTAFGFNYIADFMGLGTIIMTSQIPQGEVISTAKDNLILYYVPITSDAMQPFGMVADPTGYIGFKSGKPTDDRAQVESMAMSGIQFLVEYAAGVVFGEVNDPNMTDATVAAGSQASLWGTTITDIQEDIAVSGNAITGTLKYYGDDTKAIVKDWGAGYFLYVKFSGFSSGLTWKNVSVGLSPSEGAGMQQLDGDQDGIFKITDKDKQKLKIVQRDATGAQRVQFFDLSGLTLA